MTQLFDNWPDPYEQWFQTPIGQLVYQTELALILELLEPQADDNILDAGCGSGIFTAPLVERGVRITGVDLSLPMLSRASLRLPNAGFVAADIGKLPFADNSFDKCVSITALEFIEDAEQAFDELFRVIRPGGKLVVATLNSLSPWAARRQDNAKQDNNSIFKHAWFRSPDELLALTPINGKTRTAVHFDKRCDLAEAKVIEQQGLQQQRNDGAFLIGSWIKP